MFVRNALAVFLASLLLAASGVRGAEPAPPAATADQIRGWIKNLDNDQFGPREEAKQKLLEAANAAPAAVAEALGGAAAGESLEATLDAIELLRKLAHGERADVKTAAKGALEKLSKSDSKPLAKRAADALAQAPAEPAAEPDAAQPAPSGNVIVNGGIILNGGGIIVRGGPARIVLGNGAFMGRAETRDANGNRTIEVKTADETVNIEITKDNVKVSSTKTVEGKEKTEKYEAKDADELKKKHPEGYKLYEKYAGGDAKGAVGNVTVGAATITLQIGDDRASTADLVLAGRKAIDLARQAAANTSGDKAKKALEKLDAAGKLLDEAEKGLPK